MGNNLPDKTGAWRRMCLRYADYVFRTFCYNATRRRILMHAIYQIPGVNQPYCEYCRYVVAMFLKPGFETMGLFT